MKKEKFIKIYSIKKILIYFIIGSFIGNVYEEILNIIIHGNWEPRHTLLYGPFNPIYGLGIILLIIFLHKNNNSRNFFKTFIYCMIIGGFTEYITSFFIEKIFKIKFWDYTGQFLNINGRTTIPYIIGWGIASAIIIKFIEPWFSKKIKKVPLRLGNFIYTFVIIFISIDLILTYSALGRMNFRNKNIGPFTIIGKIYDKYYTDDYLYKKIPVMKPVFK